MNIMNNRKVLFAYDGSECANAALEDLKRAGLPSELDLLVVSVAEVWVQELDDDDQLAGGGSAAQLMTMSAHAKEGLDRAKIFAERAASTLEESFPGWRVDTRVYPDSPAWGVLRAADDWKPDLIVVGSHGRTALGRFFIGSVSQKVLSEAHCSVRIARHRDVVPGSPVRLVIGVDGTPDSEAAVREVASRAWPAGTSVKVIAAVGPVDVPIGPALNYDITQWIEEGVSKQWERMEAAANAAAGKLRDAGLLTHVIVRDSAPVPLLLDEEEDFGADCIFLGARGHRFMERFLLGSVSSAIAVRAGCSVEVVRSKQSPPLP